MGKVLIKITNLYKNLLGLSKRPFIRNVAVVASGTAASQAIFIVFTPIITRLYGPDVYGIQGIFLSVVGILATFATLSYQTAIALPKSDEDALKLAYLSIYIGVAMSALVTLFLFLFGPELLELLNVERISSFMFLLPLAMLVSVANGIVGQCLIRKKAFFLTAKFNVFTALFTNTVKTAVGFMHPTAMALIVSNTLGGVFGAVLMYFGWHSVSTRNKDAREKEMHGPSMLELAKQHSDFPIYRTPQCLINAISQSLPLLLLASYFGAGTAGQYAIAIAVLGIPANLIGNSVMQVFYPRINEAIHNKENLRVLIVKATAGLAMTGVVPVIVVVLMGPALFSFVFGAEWQTAGIYAQWLSIWIFFQYINKPAVSAVPGLRLQRGVLIYEFFSTGTKIISLYLGYFIFNSDVVAIALFSFFGVIAYAWLIFWIIHHSSNSKVNLS